MTKDDADKAFEDALTKWRKDNKDITLFRESREFAIARYFFFAGAEFGGRAIAELHNEIYEDASGVPI